MKTIITITIAMLLLTVLTIPLASYIYKNPPEEVVESITPEVDKVVITETQRLGYDPQLVEMNVKLYMEGIADEFYDYDLAGKLVLSDHINEDLGRGWRQGIEGGGYNIHAWFASIQPALEKRTREAYIEMAKELHLEEQSTKN